MKDGHIGADLTGPEYRSLRVWENQSRPDVESSRDFEAKQEEVE